MPVFKHIKEAIWFKLQICYTANMKQPNEFRTHLRDPYHVKHFPILAYLQNKKNLLCLSCLGLFELDALSMKEQFISIQVSLLTYFSYFSLKCVHKAPYSFIQPLGTKELSFMAHHVMQT